MLNGMSAMMVARPRKWHSRNYTLHQDGRHIADISLAAWSGKGMLTIEGRRYTTCRQKTGEFILDSGGNVLASAQRPDWLSFYLVIEHGARRFQLKPHGLLTSRFELSEGGTVIGMLTSKGMFFQRRIEIDLPESLPLAVRGFVAWLAISLWRRGWNAAAMPRGRIPITLRR